VDVVVEPLVLRLAAGAWFGLDEQDAVSHPMTVPNPSGRIPASWSLSVPPPSGTCAGIGRRRTVTP
jgi:hypothetical protein